MYNFIDNTVGETTRLRAGHFGVWIPAKAKHPDRLWGPLDNGVLLGGERPGNNVDHLIPRLRMSGGCTSFTPSWHGKGKLQVFVKSLN